MPCGPSPATSPAPAVAVARAPLGAAHRLPAPTIVNPQPRILDIDVEDLGDADLPESDRSTGETEPAIL
jgi:hypothetical protein